MIKALSNTPAQNRFKLFQITHNLEIKSVVVSIHPYEMLGILIFLAPLLLTIISFTVVSIAEGIKDISRRRREAKRAIEKITPISESTLDLDILSYIQELAKKKDRSPLKEG